MEMGAPRSITQENTTRGLLFPPQQLIRPRRERWEICGCDWPSVQAWPDGRVTGFNILYHFPVISTHHHQVQLGRPGPDLFVVILIPSPVHSQDQAERYS